MIRGRRQALRLGEDGLTVVEILLAVAIIGVALGGLGIVVPVSSYAVQDGNQLSTATFLAEQMLERARAKSDAVTWEWADALALPYEDDSFDAATVGFGARNFSDLDRGIAELARVVKPGGRVVILEITTPQKPPLSFFFSLWFDRLVPALGKLAGDPDAYAYLPSSVKRFPAPEALGGKLAAAGLTDVRWILTAGGIIAIHAGMVR